MLTDLETVKGHLRLDDDASDEILFRKMQQASAIVVDYLKIEDDVYDIDDTSALPIPPEVEAAVLLVVEALYDGATDPLSETIKSLLHRHRDPALA